MVEEPIIEYKESVLESKSSSMTSMKESMKEKDKVKKEIEKEKEETKMKKKIRELNSIIKNLSLSNTLYQDAINNQYMMSVLNETVQSYRNCLKVKIENLKIKYIIKKKKN